MKPLRLSFKHVLLFFLLCILAQCGVFHGLGLTLFPKPSFSFANADLWGVFLLLLALSPVTGFALAVIYVGWRNRRMDRTHFRRHCKNCDYDLTGNVSGRCPECGLPIPQGNEGRDA